MTSPSRTVKGLWTGGFALGAASHAREILVGGWLPYDFMPLGFNLYWTSLLPLDLAAAVLIWYRVRAALLLGTAIMVSDVAVNSWTVWVAGYEELLPSLMLQSGFALFVLIVSFHCFRQGFEQQRGIA